MASPPNLTYGYVPTAGEWNHFFSTKQDNLGYTPLNQAGGSMSGRLVTVASSNAFAGFSILPGAAPATPSDGDLWITSAGFFVRVNGVTISIPSSFATAAQGAKADTALQPVNIGSTVQAYNAKLASIAGISLAAGDILYAVDANTLARLPIGTSGQVLSVSGASLPSWSTTSVTGDMLKSVYDPTNINASPFARSNQTGTQAIGTVVGLQPALDAAVLSPQGRITLTSGVAVPSSDVVGATSIYYTPAIGSIVPIYNGTKLINSDFSPGLTLALSATYQLANTNYDLFIFWDGSTIRLGHGPAWTSDIARGTGAGTTEIATQKGVWTNNNSITLRWGTAAGNTTVVSANQATYVGSFRTGAAGTVTSSRKLRNLFNAYNQTTIPLRLVGDGTSWAYSTATWRQAGANSNNFVSVMAGLPTPIDVKAQAAFVNGSAAWISTNAGIGIDSTTALYPGSITMLAFATSTVFGNTYGQYSDVLPLGWHNINQLEIGAGTDTQTWYFTTNYGIIGNAVL